MMLIMTMICLFANTFVHLLKTQRTTTATTTTTKQNKQTNKKEIRKEREKESKMDTTQSVWRYYMDMVLIFNVWNGRLVLGAVEWHQNSSTSAFNSCIESELSRRHGRRKRIGFGAAKVESKVQNVKIDLLFVWLDLFFSRLKSFFYLCVYNLVSLISVNALSFSFFHEPVLALCMGHECIQCYWTELNSSS